jgi:Putative sensor
MSILGPGRLLFSRGLWASLWYLLAYQVVGWVLAAVTLTATMTGVLFGITLVGIPLLITAAAIIRRCANFERARLRPLFGEVRAGYREPASSAGLLARFRVRWQDPATWRSIAYLVGLFVPLVALEFTVLTVWAVLLSGITTPIWYWAPFHTINGVREHGIQLGYFPNGPHGPGGHGLYIGSLPAALLAAVVCLVLFLLFNYVLVATARMHATAARSLLRAPEDPLREAREVLSRPGPLATHRQDR